MNTTSYPIIPSIDAQGDPVWIENSKPYKTEKEAKDAQASLDQLEREVAPEPEPEPESPPRD